MNRVISILTLLLAAMAPLAPAQTLDELQKSIIEKYDALNSERDEKLEKLSDGYLGALARLVEQTKSTGKLDAVLPVRDAIDCYDDDATARPAVVRLHFVRDEVMAL